MYLSRNALVLEIGPGNTPCNRSDILCEKFPFDSLHRGSGEIDYKHRNYIVADGIALPFIDKSFDYVICKHVVEHSDDPVRFLHEVERVGKAGYIETPSAIAEDIFGWNIHVNRLYIEDGRLVVCKNHSQQNPPYGGLFHEIGRTDKRFSRWVKSRPDLFLTRYEWSDRIDFTMIDVADEHTARRASYVEGIIGQLGNTGHMAKMSHERIMMSKRRNSRARMILNQILACPVCHKHLDKHAESFTCSTCNQEYPILKGLPTFLVDPSA